MGKQVAFSTIITLALPYPIVTCGLENVSGTAIGFSG
jgi:hypothetical protein